MYIDRVPNRKSPPCILLRESYRNGNKVNKRTILNISDWTPKLIDDFEIILKGGHAIENMENAFDTVSSRPYGHVAAVLGSLRKMGLERILNPTGCRERDLTVAMIASRIINPCSKFATARGFRDETQNSALGKMLNIEKADEDDLYESLDWLLSRQTHIEQALAKRHLRDGVLVLYDVTSTYFEGRTCPLAKYGHSRDGKKDKLQIVFGILCTSEGIPVAVEVFEGNTADPKTLESQVKKVRERFGLSRLVAVGDRGLITEARIREELKPVAGLDWITALRAPQIKALVEAGALQLSLFGERDLAEIHSPDYPGERLIACRNPILAGERRRKREELLAATEKELEKIVKAAHRKKSPLRGKDKIGVRVGKIIGHFKVAKHFILTITDEDFQYRRDEQKISEEAAIDGVYIIRTSVPADSLDAEKSVGAYKSLATVERAFRCLKSVDLHVRPIHHRLPDRVRAHVFLCMLAYYVEWHMRKSLATLLFDDDDPEGASIERKSIVAPAQRSESAKSKARKKRNAEGFPVQSFQSLLKNLATITLDRHRPKNTQIPEFEKTTIPSPLQQRAFDLLGINL